MKKLTVKFKMDGMRDKFAELVRLAQLAQLAYRAGRQAPQRNAMPVPATDPIESDSDEETDDKV